MMEIVQGCSFQAADFSRVQSVIILTRSFTLLLMHTSSKLTLIPSSILTIDRGALVPEAAVQILWNTTLFHQEAINSITCFAPLIQEKLIRLRCFRSSKWNEGSAIRKGNERIQDFWNDKRPQWNHLREQYFHDSR